MPRATVVFLAALGLAGCGYVGDPQYPALNIPARVTDLTAVERGDRVEIAFTIPALTTEGLTVKSVGAVDLRVGPSPDKEFHIEPWAESAKRVDVAVPAPLDSGKFPTVRASVPIGPFVGKEVIVAIRLASPKGRFSEWSKLATVHVEAALTTPVGLTAIPTADGVKLIWTAQNPPTFKIYRSSAKVPQPVPLGTSEKPEYLDATAEYGVRYEYFVQAVSGPAESEIAGPVAVTPKDIFPPAVPAALVATAGLNAIELAWERNTEADFQGYRVYRAIGDGPSAVIADAVDAPNYSDRQVEPGKQYRYMVTALDRAGNESAKSSPVSAVLP